MEYVTIKITKDTFDELHTKKLITWYEVKEVTIKDGLFKDDKIYYVYKKAADKAYRDLKEYEFKKRNGI